MNRTKMIAMTLWLATLVLVPVGGARAQEADQQNKEFDTAKTGHEERPVRPDGVHHPLRHRARWTSPRLSHRLPQQRQFFDQGRQHVFEALARLRVGAADLA